MTEQTTVSLHPRPECKFVKASRDGKCPDCFAGMEITRRLRRLSPTSLQWRSWTGLLVQGSSIKGSDLLHDQGITALNHSPHSSPQSQPSIIALNLSPQPLLAMHLQSLISLAVSISAVHASAPQDITPAGLLCVFKRAADAALTAIAPRSGGNGGCPAVWSSISTQLNQMFLTNGQCNDDARAAIRAMFHDCGTWSTVCGLSLLS